MIRSSQRILGILLLAIPLHAAAPEQATLTLSLKTMGKALATCRAQYTRVYPSSDQPLLKSLIGTTDYDKDLVSLGHAEFYVNTLVAHPEKISGQILVAILSSSDDFSIGVGSTRAEVLRRMITDPKANATELAVAAEALNTCQKTLFNAGDDFVGLVLEYVGQEDRQAERVAHP